MSGTKKAINASINLVIALIFLIVGLATDYWMYVTGGFHDGLFPKCVNLGLNLLGSACEVAIEIEAARALIIVAVVGGFIALFAAIAIIINDYNEGVLGAVRGYLPLVILVCAVGGAVLAIIGIVIYSVHTFVSSVYSSIFPHFSFFLAVIGAFTLLGGGVTGHRAKKNEVGTAPTQAAAAPVPA